MKCTNCGADLVAEAKFCAICGTGIAEAEPSKPAQHKKLIPIPVIAAVGAIVVLGSLMLLRSGGGSKADYTKVIYYKEDSIMLADLRKGAAPIEIIDSWQDGKETKLIDDDVAGFARRYGSISNWSWYN